MIGLLCSISRIFYKEKLHVLCHYSLQNIHHKSLYWQFLMIVWSVYLNPICVSAWKQWLLFKVSNRFKYFFKTKQRGVMAMVHYIEAVKGNSPTCFWLWQHQNVIGQIFLMHSMYLIMKLKLKLAEINRWMRIII